MGKQQVPVSLGSERFRTVEVGGLRVTDAWFPPGQRIPPHHHDRPVLAVVVRGSFDVRFARRTHDCPVATVWTEPAGERHGNRAHNGGARVLVVQPEPSRDELLQPLGQLLREVHHFSHAGIAEAARRAFAELEHPDALAELAIESLALEILVAAQRAGAARRPAGPPPAWLRRAQDYVHAHFREPIRLATLARRAGVHPVHLSRVFRSHFATSVADYVRGLRLDWAARRLSVGDTPIGAIALEAGFADQSHFTRAFRRHAGMTPASYRAATGVAARRSS